MRRKPKKKIRALKKTLGGGVGGTNCDLVGGKTERKGVPVWTKKMAKSIIGEFFCRVG